jgi:DNA-binding MarR family transcriptional regulator
MKELPVQNSQKTSSNFYILTSQILNDERLSHTEMILMSIISGLVDEEGKCWVSNEWFAEKLDVEPRNVKKHLLVLEKNNYIKIEEMAPIEDECKKLKITINK